MPTSQALGTQGRKRQKTPKAQQRQTLTSEGNSPPPAMASQGRPCPECTGNHSEGEGLRDGGVQGKTGRPAVQSVRGTAPKEAERTLACATWCLCACQWPLGVCTCVPTPW